MRRTTYPAIPATLRAERHAMSIYASVLRMVKENPNQTQTQLAALEGAPHDANAVNQALALLVKDGRITLTGTPPTGDAFSSTDNGATYASTVTQ